MDAIAQAVRLPLNIYLLKNDIADLSSALELSSFPEKIPIAIGQDISADLLIAHTEGIPLWLKSLSQLSDRVSIRSTASTISGLLIVPVGARKCAITFGHAWQKIKPKLIEPNFGVRCVLNLAERNALRAIRRDRIAEDFIQAIEQIPDSDEIDRFGIDVERDILRGVKAKVQAGLEFGSWVAGGDSFKTSVDLKSESLICFLERCLTLWGLAHYKKDFSWVDNIAPIRDEALEAQLSEALVTAIADDHEKFVLCIPDLLAWDDFDIFSFQPKRKKHAPCADCLEFGMWLKWWGRKGATLNLAALENNYIYAYKDDGSPVQRWSVLSCIHGMLKHEKDNYLVHSGHWFRVDHAFVERINKRVASIPEATIALPAPALKEKEGDYNLRAAGESGGTLLRIDRKLIGHGGGKSRFEVCDLFTDNGHLICVKPWGQASGSLSHLFAQARISIQLLNNDPIYRQKTRDMIASVDKGFALVWEIICENPKEAEVVLAVMRGCPKESLPFFAKLALVNCIDDLQNMRFKASFVALPTKMTTEH
ncbi:DUF6119 family protein [Luteimonas panaciterrae]|uniref:DUF6119 family protein n=1 Tax=Luteimonas panaciterrae TaxID=363885 RepID=UPI001CF95A25|nr:DUF6119 family protein [Luteimonas panaciterrae]